MLHSAFGVIGSTRATVSPWTPLPAVGPNCGGLPQSQHLVSKPKAPVPSDEPPLPPFPLRTLPCLWICGEDLQQHVEQRDGPEDGCLVDGRPAIRLLVEKALFRQKLPMVRRRCSFKRRQELKDLPQDVDQCDGAGDGRLVSGLEAIRLIVQKSVVSTKVVDDGDEHIGQNDDKH